MGKEIQEVCGTIEAAIGGAEAVLAPIIIRLLAKDPILANFGVSIAELLGNFLLADGISRAGAGVGVIQYMRDHWKDE